MNVIKDSYNDILWLTFNNEQIVRALYRRLADLGNKRIRLIKFVPPWAFERNREIETQCRMAREEDPNLQTQIRLGLNDLILKIKTKGDSYNRSFPLNYFGDIPPLNF